MISGSKVYGRRAWVAALVLTLSVLCLAFAQAQVAWADEGETDVDQAANAQTEPAGDDEGNAIVATEAPDGVSAGAIEAAVAGDVEDAEDVEAAVEVEEEAKALADEVDGAMSQDEADCTPESADESESESVVSEGKSTNESEVQITQARAVEQVSPQMVATPKIAKSTGAAIATQAAVTIADGVYTIKNAATYGQALGTSNSYSANAAITSYAVDGAYDQLFYFQHVKNGLYSIISVHSGLALTASGGKVVQASYGGSDSQLFEVRSSGNFLALIAKAGAITVSGSDAKIQGYTGAAAQKFRLTEGPVIIPGVQVLRASADTGKAVRAKDGSATAGANAQIAGYSNDGSYNLVVQRKGSGYAVRPVSSGFYLAPSGSVVRQNSSESTWSVQFSTNGGRRGVMLVKGDSAAQASGGLVAVAKKAPSTAQSFLPALSKLVRNGYYKISASSGKLVDVSNGSFSNGANIQVFNDNGSGAQVFLFTDEGGGIFSIQSSKSYKVLEASRGGTGEGTNVWQYEWNGTPAQLWAPVVDSAGRITFVNVKSGKVLAVSGSNVSINSGNGSAAQHWTLKPTSKYSLTGNTKLDRIVANVLGTHTTLKSAFDYVSYSFSYRNGNKHWSGWSLSDSTSQSYAVEMYNYGSGNCYRFASLFAWLARGLGYTDVVVRTGWVVGYSAPQAPHGWVTINGYVCDPDMQHEASGRNWYWQTYASAPTAYYSW